MTTRRKITTSPTAEAASSATSARMEAEQAKAAAAQALADAEAHEAAVRARGASVTADELLRAPAEVERSRMALAEATAALEAALTQESYAVAEHMVEDVPANLSADSDQAILNDAAQAIADALRAMLVKTEARNQRLDDARARARVAGLIAGHCDPLSPVVVHDNNELEVDGQLFGSFRTKTATRTAFRRALVIAGVEGVEVTA